MLPAACGLFLGVVHLVNLLGVTTGRGPRIAVRADRTDEQERFSSFAVLQGSNTATTRSVNSL